MLHNRLVVAIPEAKRQAALHTEFTESIDPEQITAWTTAIKEWEIDNSKPCPYVSQVAREYHFGDIERFLIFSQVFPRIKSDVNSLMLRKTLSHGVHCSYMTLVLARVLRWV